MRYPLVLLVFCSGLALFAQMSMSVQQVAETVRSSLALKYDDKKIADFIKKVKLIEQLDERTIQDLQRQGAGPKTVKALEGLREQSASLKPPAQPVKDRAPDLDTPAPTSTGTNMRVAHQPAPLDSRHQAELLNLMRSYAGSYTDSLPNFICTQVTRRSVSANHGDSFHLVDTIAAKLSYNEGREDYKIILVNNQMANTSMDRIGGAISTGEFGSLLKDVFANYSEAEFAWDHWATLRGKKVAAFNYVIDSGHSRFTLDWDRGAQRIVTAYKGLVYADENTGAVARVTFEALDIPAGFPIRYAHDTLDYDDVQIGDTKYFVPLKAVVRMTAQGSDITNQGGRMAVQTIDTKNEVEFRNYRRFGTESTITFAPDPLPEEKTTEKPVQPEPPLLAPDGTALPPPPPK
jgi:hypothetical protein